MKNDPFVLILARMNSKRVKNKPLQKVGNESLLTHCVKIAKQTGWPVHVSSESETLLRIAKESGARTILRPVDLATDSATSVDAAIHAANVCDADGQIILIQITNPFLRDADIVSASFLSEKTGEAVFAARRFPQALWAWSHEGPLFPSFLEVSSQGLTPVFLPAGSFFVTTVDNLRETKSFYKPKARPFEIPESRAVDIDTNQDLEFARFLWHRRQ